MKTNGLISKVTTPIVRGVSKVKFNAIKYSPEICLILGIGTGIATVVMACRATLKTGDILDDLANEKAEIEQKEAEADQAGEEFNKGREMTVAYSHAAVGFAKTYAPSIVLGLVSGGLILSSYGIIKGRNMTLLAASTAFEKGFREYRGRVVERFGEDVDRELATGVKKQKVLVKGVDPDTGEVTHEEKEVSTYSSVDWDYWEPAAFDRIFARGLSRSCTTFDPLTNENFLLGAEEHFTRVLQTEGRVYLDDVYEHLGFSVKDDPRCRLVGWILDYADPNWREKRVSFGGLHKVYSEDGDFIYPTGKIEKTYVDSGYYLHFNIDGIIWNL